MFQRTRYILTGWYVLITLVVSIIFSVFIYIGVSIPIRKFSRIEEFRKQNPQLMTQMLEPPFSDSNNVTPETLLGRIRITLILVNGALFLVSGVAGYILAGKSLKPVEMMVDEQSRFISDASHELRAPITVIRTGLEVASMNKEIGQEANKVLKSSLTEIIQLQNLANDLLELNKYERSKYIVHFTQNSLLDISEKAITNVAPILQQKHIAVDNQFQDIKIYGEKLSLIRLLTILLENAAKYSDSNKVISLHSKISKNTILLKVVDQGVGITKEEQKFVFDRFYRTDRSRSRHGITGYGLGLAIARLIVQKHNGQISVESLLSQGSTFTVSLPYES